MGREEVDRREDGEMIERGDDEMMRGMTWFITSVVSRHTRATEARPIVWRVGAYRARIGVLHQLPPVGYEKLPVVSAPH